MDMILHLPMYLNSLAVQYGLWLYGILFLIIFCETGCVIFPFLPGDSLLFAAGAVSAQINTVLNPHYLVGLLIFASVSGDSCNYWIGRFVGPRIFHLDQSRLFNKKYLEQARLFFEKYGPKTIIMGRFMPVLRTFIPFTAGVGRMPYWRFLSVSVVGSVLWVGSFIYTSYYFGNLAFVKEHFSLLIAAVIVVSLTLPWLHRIKVARTTL